jgi:hypothetical protein
MERATLSLRARWGFGQRRFVHHGQYIIVIANKAMRNYNAVFVFRTEISERDARQNTAKTPRWREVLAIAFYYIIHACIFVCYNYFP